MTAIFGRSSFDIIPAIDLMEGRAVRLVKGDPARRTDYGDPLDAARRWQAEGARIIHVVDLDGALAGKPKHLGTAARISRETGLPVQYGGGVRTEADARAALEAARRIIIGTAAVALEPWVLGLAREFPGRILAAVDLKDGLAATHGWQQQAAGDPAPLARTLHENGVGALLITDTERDGTLSGLDPERVAGCSRWGVPFIWAGGITAPDDIGNLRTAAGHQAVGAVVGKALYEGRARLPALIRTARAHRIGAAAPEARIIPCFDLLDGRLVAGVQFKNLAPAGDPLALARNYALNGAEEIFVLDISPGERGRRASREVLSRMLSSVPAAITAGGGIRSADDVRELFRLGVDRITVNSAALERPELLTELAHAFGSHRIVLSVDARRTIGPAPAPRWEVVAGGGRRPSGLDAVEWCRRGLTVGAGEILLTSVDRDGTGSGYDLELLSAVKGAAGGPVIASGGGGSPGDMQAALRAGADGVLAASMLHSGRWEFGPLRRAVARERSPGGDAGPGSPPGGDADPGAPPRGAIAFDERGLVPAIVAEGSRVLMLGYTNAEALRRTMETGDLWLWSRSRGELWRKGETSGNTRRVHRIKADCDGDALLLEVGGGGPICHTEAESCFFRSLWEAPGAGERGTAAEGAAAPPETPAGLPENERGTGAGHGERIDAEQKTGSVLDYLWRTIEDRRIRRPADSYTARLMEAGPEQVLRKIGEEALEVILAAPRGAPPEPPASPGELNPPPPAGGPGESPRHHLIGELADLSFHMLVLMSYYGVSPDDLLGELERRRGR